MVEYKKWLIGSLILLVSLSIVYISMGDNVKIRIDSDKSTFYVQNENNRWVISGREYNGLFDGSSKMNRRVSEISVDTSINTSTNKTTIVRTTPYIRGPVIIDTYEFDGNVNDVELFPISHKVEIINGTGFFYRYEVRDLTYEGDTYKLAGETELNFGLNMNIELAPNYRWAWVYKGEIVKAQYDINSEYEIFDVRLFDPICGDMTTVTQDISSITNDDVFPELIASYPSVVMQQAEYKMCNPTTKAQIVSDVLATKFAVGESNIKSSETKIWKEVSVKAKTQPSWNDTLHTSNNDQENIVVSHYKYVPLTNDDIIYSGKCIKIKVEMLRDKPAFVYEAGTEEKYHLDFYPEATFEDADGEERVFEQTKWEWYNDTWHYRIPLDVKVDGSLDAMHLINFTLGFDAILSGENLTYLDTNETMRLVRDDNTTELPVAYWHDRDLLYFVDNFTNVENNRYWLYFDDDVTSVTNTSVIWNGTNIDIGGCGVAGGKCNTVYDRRSGTMIGYADPYPTIDRLYLRTTSSYVGSYTDGYAYDFFTYEDANYRHCGPIYDGLSYSYNFTFVSPVISILDTSNNEDGAGAGSYWPKCWMGTAEAESAIYGWADPDDTTFIGIVSITNATLTSTISKSGWGQTGDKWGIQWWGGNNASYAERCLYNNGNAGATGTTTGVNYRTKQEGIVLNEGFLACYTADSGTYDYELTAWDIAGDYVNTAGNTNGYELNSRINYLNYWMQNPGQWTQNNPEDIATGEKVYIKQAFQRVNGRTWTDSSAENVTESPLDQGTVTIGSVESSLDPYLPSYSEFITNSSSIMTNQFVNVSILLTDNANLTDGLCYISSNESGSWVNETPVILTGTTSERVDKQISLTTRGRADFRAYFNDTAGNQNVTVPDISVMVYDLTVALPSGISEIDLSTGCEIYNNGTLHVCQPRGQTTTVGIFNISNLGLDQQDYLVNLSTSILPPTNSSFYSNDAYNTTNWTNISTSPVTIVSNLSHGDWKYIWLFWNVTNRTDGLANTSIDWYLDTELA